MLADAEEKKTLKSWSVPSLHALPAGKDSPEHHAKADFSYAYKHEFHVRALGSNYRTGSQVAEPISADDYTSGTDTSGSELGRKSPIFAKLRVDSAECQEQTWIGSEQEDEDVAVAKVYSDCESCKSSDCIVSEGFCVPDWSAAGEEYLEDVETSSEIKDDVDYSLEDAVTPKFHLDLDTSKSLQHSLTLMDDGSNEMTDLPLKLEKTNKPTSPPYYFDFNETNFLENECLPSVLCSSENSELTDRENTSLYRDSLEGSRTSLIELESGDEDVADVIENVIGEALNLTAVQRKSPTLNLTNSDVKLVSLSEETEEPAIDISTNCHEVDSEETNLNKLQQKDFTTAEVVKDVTEDVSDFSVEDTTNGKNPFPDNEAKDKNPLLKTATTALEILTDNALKGASKGKLFLSETTVMTGNGKTSKLPIKIQSDGQLSELTSNNSKNNKTTVNLERLQLQRKLSSGLINTNELLEVSQVLKNATSQELIDAKTLTLNETIQQDSKSTLPSSYGNLSSEVNRLNTSSSNLSSQKDTSGNVSRSDVEEACNPANHEIELLDETENCLPMAKSSSSSSKNKERSLLRPHSASMEIKSNPENQRATLFHRNRPHSASVSHESKVSLKSPMRILPSTAANDFTKQRSRSSKGWRSTDDEKTSIELQSKDYISSMSKNTPSAISDSIDEDSIAWSAESVNKFRSFAKMRKRELLARFIAERKHKEELDQLLAQLHDSYDKLLAKHAEAENTIDQLRLGKPLKTFDMARISPQLYMHGSPNGSQLFHDIYKSPIKNSEFSVLNKKESRSPSRRSIAIQANLHSSCEKCCTKSSRDANCQTDLFTANDSFRSSVASLLLRANCLLEQVTSIHQCAVEGIKIDPSVGHQMCGYLWESLLALQRDLHSHSGHLASLEYFALEDTKCLLAKIQNQLLEIQSQEPGENDSSQLDSIVQKEIPPVLQVPDDFNMLECSKQVLVKGHSSSESVPESPISRNTKGSSGFDAISIPDGDSGCHSLEKLDTSRTDEANQHAALNFTDNRRRSSSSCFSGDTDKTESKSSNESECLHVVKVLLQAIGTPSKETEKAFEAELLVSPTPNNSGMSLNLKQNRIERSVTKPRSEDNIRTIVEEMETNALKPSSSERGGLNVESNMITVTAHDDCRVPCFARDGKSLDKLAQAYSNEDISPAQTDCGIITPVSGKSNIYLANLASQNDISEIENISTGEASLNNEWTNLMNTLKESVDNELNNTETDEIIVIAIDQSGDRFHLDNETAGNAVAPLQDVIADVGRNSEDGQIAYENMPQVSSEQQQQQRNSLLSFVETCHLCHNRYICDCSGDTQHGNRISTICDLLQEQLQSLQSSVMPNSIGNNKPSKDEVLSKLLNEVKLRLTRSWSTENKSSIGSDEPPGSMPSMNGTAHSQVFSDEASQVVSDGSEKKCESDGSCIQTNNALFDEFVLATDWGKIFGTSSSTEAEEHVRELWNSKDRISKIKNSKNCNQEIESSETSQDSAQEPYLESLYFAPNVESLLVQAGQTQNANQSISATYVYLAGEKERHDRNMLQQLNEQIQQLRHELMERGYHGDDGTVCKCCHESCQTELQKTATATIATGPLTPIMSNKASQVNMVAEPVDDTPPASCKVCGLIVRSTESDSHADADEAYKSNKHGSDVVLHCCGAHHIVRKNSNFCISEIQSEPNLKSPLLNCPYCKQSVENKNYQSGSGFPVSCKPNQVIALDVFSSGYKTDHSSLSPSDNISTDSNSCHAKSHQIEVTSMINKSVKESVETFMENESCRHDKHRFRSYDRLIKASKSEDAVSYPINSERATSSMSKLQALVVNNLEMNQPNSENSYIGVDDVSQLYNPEMIPTTINDQQQSMQLSVAIPWSEDSGTSEDETETLTESLPGSVDLYKIDSKFPTVTKPLSPSACEEQSWSSHHWQPSFGISKDGAKLETHEEETEGENAGSQYSMCLVIMDPKKFTSSDNQEPFKPEINTVVVTNSIKEVEGMLSSPETSSVAINDLAQTNSENISNDSDADSAVSTNSSGLSQCSPPTPEPLDPYPELYEHPSPPEGSMKLMHTSTKLDLSNLSLPMTLADSAIDVGNSVEEIIQGVTEREDVHGSMSDSTLMSVEKPPNSDNRSSTSMTFIGVCNVDFATQPCVSISIQASPSLQDIDIQAQPSCRDIETQMTESQEKSEQADADVSMNSEDDNMSSMMGPISSANTSASKMAVEMEDLEISDFLNPNSVSDSEVLNVVEHKFKMLRTNDLSNQSMTSSSHRKHSSSTTDDQCSCKGCRKLVRKVDVITAMIRDLTHRPSMCDESTEEDTEVSTQSTAAVLKLLQGDPSSASSCTQNS